jgi:hypothetical protein
MTCPCLADITGPTGVQPDGQVNSLDFLLLLSQWGTPSQCAGETDAPKLVIEYSVP